MKLSQAQRNHIASIDADATIAQAAAEGRAARSGQTWRDNALERAGELFQAGYWTESRAAAERGRR